MNSPTELRVLLAPSGAPGPTVEPGASDAATPALVYHADARRAVGATLILGHGAGAGQRSAFMVGVARGLSRLGIDVVTFDFPYVARGRRLPDRAPALEACYRAVIAVVRRDIESARRCLCIGGKSMGGRMATHVAAADQDCPITGLVLLGYPLHPPKRPAAVRTAHLPAVHRPMLFIHGTRDGFGTPDELREALTGIDPAPSLHIVAGGDHSLNVLKSAPVPQAGVDADVRQRIVDWVSGIASEVSRPSG